MLRIYGCLIGQHDLRLVILAAIICLFACFTTTNLSLRARQAVGLAKIVWLSVTALTFGSGVWATHFVAALAYSPGLPVEFDRDLTILSLVTAVAGTWLAMLAAIRYEAPLLGGALMGAALGIMHYVGMAALRIPADFTWDPRFVIASLASAGIPSLLALHVLSSGRGWRDRVGAASLLVLAVCGVHFTGMAAITLVPDPAIPMLEHTIAPDLLALVIGAVTISTIALALFCSFVDGHLELGAALRAADGANRAKSALLAAMTQEIKQRTLIEEALRKSEGRLTAIAANLVEGVLMVDVNGHILFANRSAHRLLGRDADMVVGHELNDVFQFVRDGVPVGFENGPILRTIETDEPFADDDAVFVLFDGHRLNVGFAVTPLKNEGRQSSAVISFRSIETLKAAQREALQSSRLASVGQLAAGIAHEINTPIQYVGDNLRFIDTGLGSVARALEGLKSLLAQTEQGESADRLCAEQDLDYLLEELPMAAIQSLEGVDHVAHIVRSMKEFSHPGTTAKVAVDINRAIESTVTVCRNEWKHVAILTTDLDPRLPPVVCFPAEVNQVLLNLIVNAAHAIDSSKSAGLGTIRIATRLAGPFVEIRVGDSGPGVPKPIRGRIFDPFFTTKEVGRGTGQGLSICLDVVLNKHGGKLFLDEAEAGGATFVVLLPFGEVAEARTPCEVLTGPGDL
jgi:PAS domain S-box-containing protein